MGKRFWTAERLTQAVAILDGLSQQDEQGKHLGRGSVGWDLHMAFRKHGVRVSLPSANRAVRALTYLGFLEHRPPGPGVAGYKRRFDPKARDQITPEDAELAWQRTAM